MSNADDDFLFPVLGKNALTFPVIVSSEEARAYKPHRSIFELLSERMGVAPENILYVGDSLLADVTGSKNAGMRAAWINRGADSKGASDWASTKRDLSGARLRGEPPRRLVGSARVAMSRKTDRSRAIFEEAQRYLPGGVNSPVRSFRGVGGDPVVVASAAGSRITDVDGNAYIDYCGSWGPLILGHAPGRGGRSGAEGGCERV